METVRVARPATHSPARLLARVAASTRVPVRQRRFWTVQALIVAVTLAHLAFEYSEPGMLGAAYFVPAALYLIPVLYASFNFGLEGAVPTALWSGALSVPDIFLNHDGTARLGEAFQVGIILLLSTVVAIRVDKERAARRASQKSERERSSSERKYRSLFENAGEAILVVDRHGVIQEANAAAADLGVDLGRGKPGVVDQLGAGAADIERFVSGEIDEVNDFILTCSDGSDIWVQPVFTAMHGTDHEEFTQVLIRDVTERHGFQHYAQEIVRAQEDERQRIAQELHDVSVQSAIMICRRLDAASAAADRDDRDAVGQALGDARHDAEVMADELRRFSRDLRPLILEDLGLVPALKRLITELQERSQKPVRLAVHGGARRLDSGVELVLFRIGQEALRNAEHHAAATRTSVSLAFERDAVRLTVTDNGVGFAVSPSTALVNAGRLGLLGMQERARLVNGRFSVRSKPGEGTQVTAEVPVPPLQVVSPGDHTLVVGEVKEGPQAE